MTDISGKANLTTARRLKLSFGVNGRKAVILVLKNNRLTGILLKEAYVPSATVM